MKQFSITLFILLTATLVGYQNCGGGGGGEPAATTKLDTCPELDFAATTLIYDNEAHVLPAVNSASANNNSNVSTANVSMTLNMLTGAASVDKEGDICTLTLASQDLQNLTSALVGIKFCGEAVPGAALSVSLRGANQEELKMDLPSASNVELAGSGDVAALLQDIAAAAQDAIDGSNCSANSNQNNNNQNN